ncbi:EboA domain-containing protein [Pseudarthrobacter sp. J75]|uniref:EboA domain-containing protein n=1 Tax=unclassified Pseudarthrobacter TaxID=2647000 RepID=UPI002E80F1EB|nr:MULTISPECIES: EboA domain-containing protein [unclassified Pseudarthrobacter]MEE2521911.1 EboA domain-containing protein [Pseudarthrobacter sp. J47]MEE2528836.1 EboA domain-containing protein [Pseudarthrobacter sp. J75]MEE2569967.1 EboA domain-containing protein [Pseudarthrobacter sp. J64]
MTPAPSPEGMPFSLGYGTNGFTDHPLPVALELMAEQGYNAVALTLGHPHLDPFAEDLDQQLRSLRARLDELGFRVVIETGTRFLLDPRRKHSPALVDEEAAVRVAFLQRAVDIAAALDAECVSFFSGNLPEGTDPETGWHRLTSRVAELVGYARSRNVTLSVEPEPGMLVETVADVLRLRAELGEPENLRVTADIGHCVVVEPGGVRGALLEAGPLLANVQLDDMLPHAHEHLPFGDGIVDVPLALATLAELGYRGVAAVELPRHSYDAPGLAARSMAALRRGWEQSAPLRESSSWLRESSTAVAADPASLATVFATAGRRVGRGPLRPDVDPSGVLFGTVSDHARGQLVGRLPECLAPEELAEALLNLYNGGDSAERRGVLRGLGTLAANAPGLPAAVVGVGLGLTKEALRTNESGVVAAAMGPFAAAHLDQHNWRHAVLKLVFMGISLDAVTDLSERADDELARMAGDFAAERTAAGRPVPDDVHRLQPASAHSTTS